MTWDQARGRYADKMRKMGTPLLVTPEEFAAAARLMERARRAGMSDRMIVEQTGVPMSLPSKVRRGAIRTMHRDTLEKLSKLHPERPAVFFAPTRGKVGGGAYVDSTGTLRRVQALRADGFPGRLLGERLGVSYEAVAQLAKSGRAVVLESTRLAVVDLYDGLDGRWPHEFGVVKHAIGKCATFARRAGYAPRSCWDPDTIDDPAAFPEWTGKCGTVFGWRIHETQEIPLCQPCADARGASDAELSGPRLLAARLRRGWSQERAAKESGVKVDQYRSWERGRTKPRYQWQLDRVLAALDVTFDEVAEQEGQPYGR